MKVFLAFIYFFGSILIIFALLWVGFLLAPQEYVLDKTALVIKDKAFEHKDRIFPNIKIKEPYHYAGALAGIAGRNDTVKVWLLVFADKKRAESVFKTYTKYIETRGIQLQYSEPGYYKYESQGFSGHIKLIDEAILHIEGRDDETIDQAFKRTGFIVPNQKPNFLTKIFFTHEYFLHLIIFILAYAGLQVPIWFRVASWAATVKPMPGVKPVSEYELRQRLFAINKMDVPFQAIEGKRGKVDVIWRLADAKWLGLMTANQLRYVQILRMKLSEKDRTCRSLDISKRVEISADGRSAKIRFSLNLFRGIVFAQWEYEKEYGFVLKDGSLKFDTAYEYKFDIKELKSPAINIIVSSGWQYKPVVTFIKFLGG